MSSKSQAALSYTIGGSWDTEARRTAATNAMQAVVNRYNAYGFFGNYNIWVYYEPGIPTAQASYQGSIGFGGTWPAERVAMHEAAHYLGLPAGSDGGWQTEVSRHGDSRYGRAYPTALVVLALQAHNELLPVFQR
jgi:hypothetical protein